MGPMKRAWSIARMVGITSILIIEPLLPKPVAAMPITYDFISGPVNGWFTYDDTYRDPTPPVSILRLPDFSITVSTTPPSFKSGDINFTFDNVLGAQANISGSDLTLTLDGPDSCPQSCFHHLSIFISSAANTYSVGIIDTRTYPGGNFLGFSGSSPSQGFVSARASASVPEPSTLLLMLVGGIMMLFFWRFRILLGRLNRENCRPGMNCIS
jgi:PEP-CTERM motif